MISMVHIHGPYYFDSDGVRNFTLYERKVVTSADKTQAENVEKTYDSPLGYYPTLAALMQGYLRQQSFSIAQSKEAMELSTFIHKLDSIIDGVSFSVADADGAQYLVSVSKVPQALAYDPDMS